MAFKSYAKGGNYGSYNILPISTEVNEDLRIANEKVQDIQLTAQTKANHAQEYISALNNKFKVEQQNRDDNNQFFLKNHKAIYEGEQRQFEGEMAAMQRRHAKEAQKEAEPSVLQKALPHILSLVQVGAGMMAETAAAKSAAGVEAVNNVSAQGDAVGVNIAKMMGSDAVANSSAATQAEFKQALGIRLNPGGTPEEVRSTVDALNLWSSGDGKIQQAWQSNAIATASRNAQYETATNVQSHTYGSDWRGYQRAVSNSVNRLTKENLPEGYLDKLTPESQAWLRKSNGKFNNKMAAEALPNHKKAARAEFNQIGIHHISKIAAGTGEYEGLPPGKGLVAFTDTWSAHFQGDMVATVAHIIEITKDDPAISSNHLREWGLLLSKQNPGTAAADPTKRTSVLRLIDEATRDKVKAEQNTTIQHNRGMALQEDQRVREIGNMEREQAQQALAAVRESGRPLTPKVEKALKARAAGQPNRAGEQAKLPDYQLPMESQRSMVNTAIEAGAKEKWPKYTGGVEIAPEITEEVRRDTFRELARFAREAPDFEENITDYFKEAAAIAVDKQKWGIEGSGLTGTLTRESVKHREQGTSEFIKGLFVVFW